jgi:uncharacterized protein (DUF2236 family)
MVWKIGGERVLLVGGQAALLLQLAHPLIAEAVSAHSGFRDDPLQRLRQTLDATLLISFGDKSQSEGAADRVRRTHRRVRGDLAHACGPFPAGTPFSASEPELAMWVHATLVWSALEVFDRFVAPLGGVERDRYYQESKRFAQLFGATPEVMPGSLGDFQAYFNGMITGPTLTVCEPARTLASEILRPPIRRLGWALSVARTLTTGLLPDRLRRDFGLAWGGRERSMFAFMRVSTRLFLRGLPGKIRYWPHYLSARERVAESARGALSPPDVGRG